MKLHFKLNSCVTVCGRLIGEKTRVTSLLTVWRAAKGFDRCFRCVKSPVAPCTAGPQ